MIETQPSGVPAFQFLDDDKYINIYIYVYIYISNIYIYNIANLSYCQIWLRHRWRCLTVCRVSLELGQTRRASSGSVLPRESHFHGDVHGDFHGDLKRICMGFIMVYKIYDLYGGAL